MEGFASRLNFAHNPSPFNPSFCAVMKIFNAPRVSSPRSLMLPGPAPAAALLEEGAAAAAASSVAAGAPSGAVSFLPSVVSHRPRRSVDTTVARCDATVAAPFFAVARSIFTGIGTGTAHATRDFCLSPLLLVCGGDPLPNQISVVVCCSELSYP